MTDMNENPPNLPTQRRFELLKGAGIGVALIALVSFGIAYRLSGLIFGLIGLATLALIVVLFCKQRRKIVYGMLLSLVAVPLLLVGACFGVMAFS